jgi:Flp pilus assembly protein TadG
MTRFEWVRRLASWRRRRRGRGQALVEFGLVLPMFLILLMVSVQVSILFTAELTVIWMSNQVVRYVATGSPEHWRFTDSCHITYWRARLPVYLTSANLTTFTITPSYTPASGDCNNVSGNVPATTRVRGTPIKVTMQYTPTNLVVLPVNFMGASFLTTLPSTSATAVME